MTLFFGTDILGSQYRGLQMKMTEVYGRQPVQDYLFLLPPNVVAARPLRSSQKKSPDQQTAFYQVPLVDE